LLSGLTGLSSASGSSRTSASPWANRAGGSLAATAVATAERPCIVQQPAQLRDVVAAGLVALVAANEPPALFAHGDALVRLEPDADDKPVKPLSKAQLRLTLSDAADFVTEVVSKDGEVTRKPAFPRPEVVESIQDHAGGWRGIPSLKAVVNVPVLTAVSGLLTRPGFDAASGVYLLPSGHHDVDPIPERPDADDVEQAKELLLGELLGDFPFVDEASRANTLALFLLPFVRDLIDGPTPLHHIDAPQEGTGKSLLAEVWGAVALGRALPSFGEVTRPDDWQKTILAALMEAPPVIFLDNLNRNRSHPGE
jgi:putative DNA primase/helicase